MHVLADLVLPHHCVRQYLDRLLNTADDAQHRWWKTGFDDVCQCHGWVRSSAAAAWPAAEAAAAWSAEEGGGA